MLGRTDRYMFIYVILVVVLGVLVLAMANRFFADEDQGRMFALLFFASSVRRLERTFGYG